MNSILLATKFHRLTIPTNSVPRPHLVQRLNNGLAMGHQMTLVSAPAGFGKTTCISAWINILKLPVSWLSLDPADDDPRRFFSYFIAALQIINENLGREIEGVLYAGQLPPCDVISVMLINEIEAFAERFVLVLDDFQVIQDPFIFQVLDKLVTQGSDSMHLVLLTREDPALPLARLRANNQLTEIRAGDLRFSSKEIEKLLNDFMGLDLSREDIAVLEARTEGWVVGLLLAGISIRDRTNPSEYIANLSGSHRFILNYLTEEVLNQQPEDIQQFLLQTSILDRFCGDLCNTVTERIDSHVFLEQLLTDNLFLIPLDDDRQWYRYHPLFAELLLNLQNIRHKDQMASLHQRASHWYAQANMAAEAIDHALAASDYAWAVELLEIHAMEMIMQGYAKTVNSWVQAIPDEWRSQSIRTYLAFAWMHALSGNYSQAILNLDRLDSAFQVIEDEDPAFKAEWMALRCLMFNMQGKATEGLDLANQALHLVPDAAENVLSLIYMALAGSHQLKNDDVQAIEAFKCSIKYGRSAGNIVAEMMSTAGLALLALERGQLHLAFEITSPVTERIHRAGALPPITAVVFGVLGQVHYHWHQFELAREHILRAIQLSALGGYNSGAVYYRVLLARVHQIEGDLEAAAQEIQEAVDRLQVNAPTDIRQDVIHQQIRIYLAQGRLATAELALQGSGFSFRKTFIYPDLETETQATFSVGSLYNSALRILLYQAQTNGEREKLKSGIKLAHHLIAASRQRQNVIVNLETLLLCAQMQALLGNEQASKQDYQCVLEMAEPEGFISIFVEQDHAVAEALNTLYAQNMLGKVHPNFVQRILAAFSTARQPENGKSVDSQTKAEASGLIELFSDRELEVLSLMATGLKYAEIAEKLYISVNTVRYHVKAIYGKLNVNNRTKAIEKAQSLNLL